MERDGTLYFNGKVTCIRPIDVVHSAILTRGDRIVAVGKLQVLQVLATFPYETIDLKGKRVLPGLIDTHAHFLDTGFSYTKLNLGDVKTIGELLTILSKEAEKHVPGEWITAVNFDENRLANPRFPTLAELDQAIPDHPVYINHRSYHSSVVNSLAIESSQLIIKAEEDVYGGAYLSKANNTNFKAWIARQTKESDLERAIAAVSGEAVKRGLTTIHCIEGGEYWGDAYAEFIHRADQDLLDLILYYNTDQIEKVIALDLPRMGGDLFVDGSVSGRSAAFMDEYDDQSDCFGELYMTDAKVESLIEQAYQHHIQISFHVIGNRAIEQILSAYEWVLNRYPKYDHRHRIEHFGFPSDAQIRKAKNLGLSIATQPAFVYLKGENYRTRLGEERLSEAYPLRKLVDMGLRVGGGSDSLVTPLDPLLGIHAAVNAPYPAQRLTRVEAIELYTICAAELAFEESEKGSLEADKFADFVVLEQDLLEVPELEIRDVEVAMTIYRGRCVYQRKEEE
jgi:hypothetical protein